MAAPTCKPVSGALLAKLRSLSRARTQLAVGSTGHAACCQWQQAHCSVQRRRAAATATAGTANGGSSISRSVLFLSPVWAERSSSAAGVRTTDLLEAFQQHGWAAAYASSSAPNEHTSTLAAAGVAAHHCQPNREHELAAVLASSQPSVAVFDRYIAEEFYSFRVRELAPDALRVLDMQDFHSLRAARRQLAEAGAPLEEVLACRPDANASDCLRELAAIHRSDLTLVCSPVELEMLAGRYQVPQHKLILAPFFAPPSPYAPAAAMEAGAGTATTAQPGGLPFGERKHFLMIGNWRHPPNLDSARWACSEIWPALRASLPPEHRDAELHMYGAYPAGAAQQLHRPKEGVHMKGFAPSLDLMLQYRILLAPLQYGAGLKGKVVDAWWHGLPVATTPIGAEGMQATDATCDDLAAAGVHAAAAAAPPDSAADGYVWQMGGSESSSSTSQAVQQGWGGLCGATTAQGMAASAALLYCDEQLWHGCQRRGFELLQLLYGRERRLGHVYDAVEAAAAQLEERRRQDYTGSMLWQQQARATEYFSRWIEMKEARVADSVSNNNSDSSAGKPVAGAAAE